MLNNYQCANLSAHTIICQYKVDPTVLMDVTGIDHAKPDLKDRSHSEDIIWLSGHSVCLRTT